jgi:hypothetical protein
VDRKTETNGDIGDYISVIEADKCSSIRQYKVIHESEKALHCARGIVLFGRITYGNLFPYFPMFGFSFIYIPKEMS